MTLQEIKNEVLSYTDCDSWDELISSGLNTVDRTIDLVAERYAQSELSEANKEIERLKGQLEFDTDHIGRMHQRIESQQQKIERLKEEVSSWKKKYFDTQI